MVTNSVTCTAKSKQSGQRCKRRPIPGGSVCHIHGGGAPQVREAAELRLLRLQAPAIDTMSDLMERRREYPSTAYQAARDVLDRTMGKAIERQQQEVRAEVQIRWKD